MPSLPQYDASRNITARTSQPLRSDVAVKYKADQQVIGAIQGVTQKWSNAHDVMQYTEAKGKYEVEVARIQAAAAQDPDYKGSDKYYRELEDSKKNSLVGISNKQVLERLSMEMDFGNQMAGIKIDNNFKQKEIIANKFKLAQSVEGLQQKKLQAEGAEAMEYDNQIKELLALNVTTGVITVAEAEEIQADANILSAEFDATVNPDRFKKNGAKYYGIPEDKYQKLKATATLSKERGEKEALEAQDEIQEVNETQLIMALANKEIDRLSVPEITKKIMNGEISREFGDAYIRVLKSPKHIDRKKKIERSGFTKYAQELFKSEDPKVVKAAIINMLDGAANGELNENQLAVLLKVADKAGKDGTWFGNIIDFFIQLPLGPALKGVRKMNADRMTFDFVNEINAGIGENEAKDIAIEKEQKRTNPLRSQYAIGDEVMTPAGVRYVWGYYPNGDPDVYPERPPKK